MTEKNEKTAICAGFALPIFPACGGYARLIDYGVCVSRVVPVGRS